MIQPITKQTIQSAISLLDQNKLVAVPTETVYGLAANALEPEAVVKIFEAKNRPYFDPLIVHTHSISRVYDYVSDFDETLKELATHFWPGPLTILLPKKSIIPDIVTSGLPHVAMRVPNHAMLLSLLEQLSFPLAAPSANPFGYVSPTTAQHVYEQLGIKIPLILDGGTCAVGLESTIVGIRNNRVVVHRLGGTTIEAIEALVGSVDLEIQHGDKPQAPGTLTAHYAPKKPLIIGNLEDLIAKHHDAKLAVLSFGPHIFKHQVKEHIVLSGEANLAEAAAALFSALRRLDTSDADLIITEVFPDEGLGKAINDRLKRASVSKHP